MERWNWHKRMEGRIYYGMKRKHLDIIIVAFLCVLLFWRFVFYGGDDASQGQLSGTENKVTEETILQTEEISLVQTEESIQEDIIQEDIPSLQSNLTETEQIWEKIAMDNILALKELVDLEQMKGLSVKSDKEEVRQDEWVFKIQGAYITKQKNEIWDFVPDGPGYVFDESGNLISDYSYVAIQLKVKRVAVDLLDEMYLNSIWLRIYDGQGEHLDSAEAETAALNKPQISSYFRCPLAVGEEVETEIVYVVQDCYLSDENYYLIKIQNWGVTSSFEAKDLSLIRVPLGRGVEDEKTDSDGM